jgi:hypothetical protein
MVRQAWHIVTWYTWEIHTKLLSESLKGKGYFINLGLEGETMDLMETLL